MQVMRRLSLDLGIRYEYTTPWNERFNRLAYFDPYTTDPLTGRFGALVFLSEDQRFQTKPDTNNVAPRVGVAWEFIPRTVLRAGAGVFYAQGNGGVGAVASELGGGFQTTTSVFLGPPNTVSNRPPAGSFSNPFSTGLIQPPSSLVGESVRTTARNTVTPYNYQWTASLQRQLTPNLLVEAAYAGSRGLRLWRDLELNALDADYLASIGGNELQRPVDNPFFGQIKSGALSARTVQRFRLLLSYPQYAGVTQFRATAGDSNYHALTVKVDKRFAKGFAMLVSYTASKQINNVPEHFIGTSSVSDATDLTRDRSLADYDTPQRLVISYIWELPLGKSRQGWIAALIGGWQLSGVTSFQSGVPLVITAPNAAPFPGLSSRAVRLRSGAIGAGQTRERWFDTDAFLLPDAFTLGNDSRTQPDLRGPETIHLMSILIDSVPPALSSLRSCRTRKSFTWLSRGRSPISSRNTVKMNSLLCSDLRQILQRLFDSRARRQPETQARAVWAIITVRPWWISAAGLFFAEIVLKEAHG